MSKENLTIPVNPVIVWFRQDLRLEDNPALFEAAQRGVVIPVYILDDGADSLAGVVPRGAASRWWLHHSLGQLNESLNHQLSFYRGDPQTIILDLIRRTQAKAVYWNRCYEPWRRTRDQILKRYLQEQGITCQSFNGSLLWEPWTVQKHDGTPYKVFTPFYNRGCLTAEPPRKPLPKPAALSLFGLAPGHRPLDSLGLLPKVAWYQKFQHHWQVGEMEAQQRLAVFLAEGLLNYQEGRDFPAQQNVSRLSPHLHFGEISPQQVWLAINKCSNLTLTEKTSPFEKSIETFRKELVWREFAYHLLFHFPDLPTRSLQKKFDAFPWLEDAEALRRWQTGQTGYPIVDAGMRELWQTGVMHNRVRMIVGSFLVKNLLLPWQQGAQWFWDCLLDADLANNSMNWQWVAGCGADAAPYFRVFNPVTQAEKFDPTGAYIRRFVPELTRVPDAYLFDPSRAPEGVLAKAGLILDQDYPRAIVDLGFSRMRALNAFHSLKEVPH